MSERSMRGLNLAFRFILELIVLAALFLWGMSLSDSLPIQLILGLGMPIAVIALWGGFVAPRAARRLEDPARLAVELVIWMIGAVALGFVVSWILAILFGLAVFISLLLMFYWDQRGA